eukprot:5509777-Alexandrium_andersonii.AAC.1
MRGHSPGTTGEGSLGLPCPHFWRVTAPGRGLPGGGLPQTGIPPWREEPQEPARAAATPPGLAAAKGGRCARKPWIDRRKAWPGSTPAEPRRPPG